MHQHSKLINSRLRRPSTDSRLQEVISPSAPVPFDLLPANNGKDKFRIFLKSGKKNVQKNFEMNALEVNGHKPEKNHVWVSFCVPYFRQEYKLSDIECSVAAPYKAFYRWSKEPLSKRALAKQIGISTSTLHLAEKRLCDLGILIHDKNLPSSYCSKKRKVFRWVYRWNPFCESGLKAFKNCKIESLKRYNLLKQKRTLPLRVKSQNSFNKNTRLPAPHILLSGSWWEYRQHFARSDTENLKSTIYHALKSGTRLPKVDELEEFRAAIKKAATIPFLKQAHLIGWREASKSRLVARGVLINDRSKSWAKYEHGTLNFWWFLNHWRDVLAGEYDERALSAKAKRVWTYEEKTYDIIDTTRPETPEDVLNEQIITQSTCEEEIVLRQSLLAKHGTYVYENWFQGCGWSKEAGKLTHGNVFYRYEIERKYGLVVLTERMVCV